MTLKRVVCSTMPSGSKTGNAGDPTWQNASGGTVREDYSEYGTCWDYFPHDHARSRVYRWGEEGFLGIADRECCLCFALALWNGCEPILKERLIPSCQRLERIEYVHGEHGRGLGASHQTGWTALVTCCLEDLAKTALLS